MFDEPTKAEKVVIAERMIEEWRRTAFHIRRFVAYRRDVPDATHNADQKNAPHLPQFEGVVFSDGRVAIRWLTAKRSVAVWDSLEDMLAIHGHPEYGSELVWLDDGASSKSTEA